MNHVQEVCVVMGGAGRHVTLTHPHTDQAPHLAPLLTGPGQVQENRTVTPGPRLDLDLSRMEAKESGDQTGMKSDGDRMGTEIPTGDRLPQRDLLTL